MTPSAAVARVGARLPQGAQLDAAAFRARLHVVRLGLLIIASTVAIVGLLHGVPTTRVGLEMLPVVVALAIGWRARGRVAATASVTIGLALAASSLVHFTEGQMESHSAFFVILPLIALLHDWRAVIGATVLVFAQHAIAATIGPSQVYDHPAAQEHPFFWGAVHLALISSLVIILFVHWNYSEAEQRATHQALAEANRSQSNLVAASERFRSLVQNAFDAIIVIDETKTITYIGGAFKESFGWSPNDLLGRHASSLLGLVHAEDTATIRHALDQLRDNEDVQITEARFRHPDGSWRWIELVVRTTGADDVLSGLVINARDITTTKLANDLLAHRATHDELTGLATRPLLVEQLDQALAERSHGSVGLLFLDLDRFKNINDSMGHDVGDELLTHVARCLEQTMHGRGTVARLGGDEFAILVNGASTADSLRAIGERIAECLAGPFLIGGYQLRASASIGIVLGTPGNEDAALLLRNADGAMYQAKQAGRNQIAEFDEKFRDRADKRLVIESELRVARLDQEMVLHYQPVVDTQSGEIFGVESLIRWNHPTRGLLMPGEFISVAEDTGLILQLGEWVLRSACRQAMSWDQQFGIQIHMAVNVSARQLGQPGFTAVVERALEDSGLPADRLLLEVTESALVDDPVMADANLTELRQLGVSLALDDYGTGYASLQYLRALPLTHIKIDRSFTSGLGISSESTTIVENTVSLARGLGLIVVGEGVETADQQEILKAFGCDLAQGYHLGRPMSPERIEAHPLFRTRLALDELARSTRL